MAMIPFDNSVCIVIYDFCRWLANGWGDSETVRERPSVPHAYLFFYFLTYHLYGSDSSASLLEIASGEPTRRQRIKKAKTRPPGGMSGPS